MTTKRLFPRQPDRYQGYQSFEADSQAEMLALQTARQGDICIRSDLEKTYILQGTNPERLADWRQLPGSGEGPGGPATWGDITGNLADQTDLAAALAAKQDQLDFEGTNIEGAAVLGNGAGGFVFSGLQLVDGNTIVADDNLFFATDGGAIPKTLFGWKPDGTFQFYRPFRHKNTLTVTGAVQFQNSLTVAGAVQFQNLVTVTGAVQFQSTLNVASTVTAPNFIGAINSNPLSIGGVRITQEPILFQGEEVPFAVLDGNDRFLLRVTQAGKLVFNPELFIVIAPDSSACFVTGDDGQIWRIDIPGGAKTKLTTTGRNQVLSASFDKVVYLASGVPSLMDFDGGNKSTIAVTGGWP